MVTMTETKFSQSQWSHRSHQSNVRQEGGQRPQMLVRLVKRLLFCRKGFILLSALADKFNNGEDCGVYEETLGGLDYEQPECHTVHETGFRTEFKTECGKVHSRVCQTSYRTVCEHGQTSECKVKYSKQCSTAVEVQCSPVCSTQYSTVCSPQAGYSGDTLSSPGQGYATPETAYGPAQECQEVTRIY